MKKLTFIIIILFFTFSVIAQTVTISEPSSTIVCNNTNVTYTAVFSDLDSTETYTVDWDRTNGSDEGTSSDVPLTTSTHTVKWNGTSGTNGNIGVLSVTLKLGNTVLDSDSKEFTIKSLKHLKSDVSPGLGGQLYMQPCDFGTMIFDATDMIVPGTEDEPFPDKVHTYEWKIPKDWSIGGIHSTGSNTIQGAKSVTVTYPASGTGGTIKVRGKYVGCGTADNQDSKWSDPVTIVRTPTLTLATTTGKNWLFCGDTNPVNFVLTPALPCAVYYWNGSMTSTTSNTFSYTPNGEDNFTVSVRVVYGDSRPNFKGGC